MSLVDVTVTDDGSVEVVGHQVVLHWDKVIGEDAYWSCTCGAVSPIVPMCGRLLRAAFEHHIAHLNAFHKVSDLLAGET
jgi:hypothetical protein